MRARRLPIGKLLLAGLLALAGAVAAFDLWDRRASAETSRRIHASETYWRAALKEHVRVGEKRSDVEAWLRTQVPQHLDKPPRFYPGSPPVDPTPALLASQTIDVVGWKFPCSFWMVTAEIELDHSDRVAGWKVSKAGMCL